MNIFKPTTLTWWQVAAFKLAVLLVGIAIGANWPQAFQPYAVPMLVVALLLSVYLGVVWARER